MTGVQTCALPISWNSAGTEIDTTYEALDEIARSQKVLLPNPKASRAAAHEGFMPPTLKVQPERALRSINGSNASPVLESEVTLVHPWDLAEPATEGIQKQRLGIIHLPFHADFPWSERRWNFVMTRMREVTNDIFMGDIRELIRENKNIKFSATATYNFGYREALSASNISLSPIRRFTDDPEKMCGSFTKFWAAVGRERVARGGRRK